MRAKITGLYYPTRLRYNYIAIYYDLRLLLSDLPGGRLDRRDTRGGRSVPTGDWRRSWRRRRRGSTSGEENSGSWWDGYLRLALLFDKDFELGKLKLQEARVVIKLLSHFDEMLQFTSLAVVHQDANGFLRDNLYSEPLRCLDALASAGFTTRGFARITLRRWHILVRE